MQCGSIIVACLLPFTWGSPAIAAIIGFEGLSDGVAVANQFPNLQFTNAKVATAGISLNEFEFPPHSGVNVVIDASGPITITFSLPALAFSGFFTYATPLTLIAFDAGNHQIGSLASAFSNNEALSGVLGSSPNELLSLASPGGISKVIITGKTNGSSFTVDDVSFTPSTPEPRSAALLIAGLALIALMRTKFRPVPRK